MMKLTLHSFTSDVPREKICQPGVDYQVYETDVTPEEALTFFDRLSYPRDGFYLEVPECLLNFWRREQSIWVEVTSAEFWATAEVSSEEAKAIIEALYLGEKFGSHIPTANREWDAYAILGTGLPG
jgi:hypothetical protein